eukprot:CAMPEP_0115494820 /NCGR_PEP_ID=MMETSP0271-20121206/64922_1 /TAXON_ID=71861 /ORGANISM="Scrippsiella trochoidea, Strain CCMP3099" /LENGTH=58 /DNA_ID=CAMNT_0002923421 /DNA_START=22 /DNA_END=194 /DNA_ORIENTATION=+
MRPAKAEQRKPLKEVKITSGFGEEMSAEDDVGTLKDELQHTWLQSSCLRALPGAEDLA